MACVKIFICGEAGVGKTCLINQIIYSQFIIEHIPTFIVYNEHKKIKIYSYFVCMIQGLIVTLQPLRE